VSERRAFRGLEGSPAPLRDPVTDPKALELQSLLVVDRLVHEPARLAILAVLAAAEEAEFIFLEQVLGITRGIPVTRYQITARGRKALEAYRRQMLLSLGRGKALP